MSGIRDYKVTDDPIVFHMKDTDPDLYTVWCNTGKPASSLFRVRGLQKIQFILGSSAFCVDNWRTFLHIENENRRYFHTIAIWDLNKTYFDIKTGDIIDVDGKKWLATAFGRSLDSYIEFIPAPDT